MASSAASLPARTVRSAFLIGQHTYEHDKFANLEFAGNDVRELADVLGHDCGFKVERLMDAKKADFADLPNRFARSLEGCADSVFLLYYAGHGLCCKGQPYLVPVDAAEADPESCINLYGLIRRVHDVAEGACGATRRRAAEASSSSEAPGSVLLIVLDSCREWPKSYAEAHWEELRMTEAKPPRAVTTEVSILFACDEGQLARENHEMRHGFFTAAFLRALKCPGLTWREVCWKSRASCLKESRGLQRPWTLESGSQKSDGLVLHAREEALCDAEMVVKKVDAGYDQDLSVDVMAVRGHGAVLFGLDPDFNWLLKLSIYSALVPLVLFFFGYVFVSLVDEEKEVVCLLPRPTDDPYIQSVCMLPGFVEIILLMGTPPVLFLHRVPMIEYSRKPEVFTIFASVPLGQVASVLWYSLWELVWNWLFVDLYSEEFADVTAPNCAAIVTCVGLSMVARWVTFQPPTPRFRCQRKVQLFEWAEGLESWPAEPTLKTLVFVCTKLLPFWLMQGGVSFLLLEIGWNVSWLPEVPWYLKVPLLVSLAGPAAIAIHDSWLSKVGCDQIHGWHFIDVLLSSILASHYACSLFLSFDPSMRWHQLKSPSVYRGINYEAFTTVVAMSVMALWRRDDAQVDSEQSAELVPPASSEPPLV